MCSLMLRFLRLDFDLDFLLDLDDLGLCLWLCLGFCLDLLGFVRTLLGEEESVALLEGDAVPRKCELPVP